MEVTMRYLFKSFLEWYTNILKDVEPKETKHYY